LFAGIDGPETPSLCISGTPPTPALHDQPTDSTALYTTAWPHHPEVVYRPLLPGTVVVPTSDHGHISTAGCSSSPYSELQTLCQIGFTPPGNVTRWWLGEGMGPHGYAPYFPYTYTPPTPCNPDNETQDDRVLLSQTGEMQMLWGWDRYQHIWRCSARLWG
jgi:hypothetical protein